MMNAPLLSHATCFRWFFSVTPVSGIAGESCKRGLASHVAGINLRGVPLLPLLFNVVSLLAVKQLTFTRSIDLCAALGDLRRCGKSLLHRCA